MLVQDDGVGCELIVDPEMARRERLYLPLGNLPLQSVADPKTSHRNVFFAQITVERCSAGDLRVEVLNVVHRGFDHPAIRLAHANITDIKFFESFLVAKSQKPECLYSGIRLDAHAGGGLARAGAVGFEA